MLQPLLELYKLLESKKQVFIDAGLAPFEYLDVYRGQPLQPQLYEYFPLPAIFIGFSMTGNGIRQKRTVTMELHLITDTMPDTSNISEQKDTGVKRFMYYLLVQQILEDSTLGKTTKLVFGNEEPIEIPVINYHTQTYSFDAFLSDMMGNIEETLGQFEALNIFGNIKSLL